uniref:polynucleotide adenylyltransferase n=1 Tax=Fundulus heteroclitus TaxID=8078 RepID=A0A3Q2NWX5_FUNHE
MHQPEVLLLVKESLSGSRKSPYSSNHANCDFFYLNSDLICKVSAGNENAFQTTSYLSALANMDGLLLPLVLGLRRWAQICEIDRPEEGGLPPYVLALMVIFYLQKRKEPLLPTYLNQGVCITSQL